MPRQDSASAGNITEYKIYASNEVPDAINIERDGTINNEGFVNIGSGTLESDKSLKNIDVDDTKTRYVTLVVTSGDENYGSAAEIYVNKVTNLARTQVNNINSIKIGKNGIKVGWEIQQESSEYVEKYVVYNNDEKIAELDKDVFEYNLNELMPGTQLVFLL